MTQKIINVIDIGSSRILCTQAICDVKQQKTKILAMQERKSEGFSRGKITNKSALSNCILNTVDATEKASRHRFQHLFVNTSSALSQSKFVHVRQAQNGVVTTNNILQLSRSITEKTANDQHLLHMIPLRYSIDSYDGVRDPRGMRCSQLSGHFHTITIPSVDISLLAQLFQDCHLNVSAFISTPFASGLGASVQNERDVGVVVIDIGADLAHISAFYEGQCIHAGSIHFGGNHLTFDISYILGCSFTNAERIKRLHGSALPLSRHAHSTIEIPMSDLNTPNTCIDTSYLTNIIRARLEEIFTKIKQYIHKSGLKPALLQRAVITGGVAQTPRIKDLAASILQMQVRVATPTSAHASNSSIATSLGMLHLKEQEHYHLDIILPASQSWLIKIKHFFQR